MPNRHLRLKIACIATGLLVGLLVAGVAVYLTPPKYESSAIAQIVPPATLQTDSKEAWVRHLTNETELLLSDNNLSRITENLKLTERWDTTPPQCIQTLRDVIRVEGILGTDLVKVVCRHTNRVDAREIAEEVILAHRQHLKMSGQPAGTILLHSQPVISENPLRHDMTIGLFAAIFGGLALGVLLARLAVPRAAADNQHPPEDGPTNEWTTPEMASKVTT